MADHDEIVRKFLVESFEGLDQLDRDLVAFEDSPSDRDLLAAIFRCVHTIKGTCGFLGFTKLESVTHVGENLLGQLRDGHIELTEELNRVLLRMVDAVRKILSAIDANLLAEATQRVLHTFDGWLARGASGTQACSPCCRTL